LCISFVFVGDITSGAGLDILAEVWGPGPQLQEGNVPLKFLLGTR